MTVARRYRMEVAEGKGAEPLSVLNAFPAVLSKISGFEDANLLCDGDQPDRFTFIEKWSSAEAHKKGGLLLPKAALVPVLALLGGRPEVT